MRLTLAIVAFTIFVMFNGLEGHRSRYGSRGYGWGSNFLSSCIRNGRGSYNDKRGRCSVRVKRSGKSNYKFLITCTKITYSEDRKQRCTQIHRCQKIVQRHGRFGWRVISEKCQAGKETCKCLQCKKRGRRLRCSWKNCPSTPPPEPTCSVRDEPVEGCDGLLNSIQECIKESAQNVENLPSSEVLDIRPIVACLSPLEDLINEISLSPDLVEALQDRLSAYVDLSLLDTESAQSAVDAGAQIGQVFSSASELTDLLIDLIKEDHPSVVAPELGEYTVPDLGYADPQACDVEFKESDASTIDGFLDDGVGGRVLNSLNIVKEDCKDVADVTKSIDEVTSPIVAFVKSLVASEMNDPEIELYQALIDALKEHLPSDLVIPPELESPSE